MNVNENLNLQNDLNKDPVEDREGKGWARMVWEVLAETVAKYLLRQIE